MSGHLETIAFVASRTNATENLHSYRFVRDSGGLDSLDATTAGEAPTFLCVHPELDVLYVADSVDDGALTAVAFDRHTGEVSVVNAQPTGGAGPCYCSVDATGSYAFVAHYRGGSVSVLPVDEDGRLGERTQVVEHEGRGVDPDRQTAPHPHSIVPGPDNEFAYVPDLGTDRVVVYRIDLEDGCLDPVDSSTLPVHPGAGPRHLEFHPDERVGYLINELDSTITAFERNPETGALAAFQTVETLPAAFDGDNKTADVHVHPSGRFVYGSNRGHDSVASFAVDDDDRRLTPLGHESTRGEWPRNFAIDPTGASLLVENLHSDEIVTFDVDAETGTLDPTDESTAVPRPMCLAFLAPDGHRH